MGATTRPQRPSHIGATWKAPPVLDSDEEPPPIPIASDQPSFPKSRQKTVLFVAISVSLLLGFGFAGAIFLSRTPEGTQRLTKDEPTDLVSAFKKLVQEVRTRGLRSIDYVERATIRQTSPRYSWGRYRHSWVIDGYDVTKTDSLITPYRAIIEISELIEEGFSGESQERDSFPFPTEERARNANVMKPTDRRKRSAKYIWQDGRWLLSSDSSYKFYPVSDNFYKGDPSIYTVRYLTPPQ